MKKILLLGGSQQQVVAIEKAKEMGYETILCDYLSDNPGKDVADRFYQASTTNKEDILEVAIKEDVDGILAYASDPAAPTAAFVAEELGLAGNPADAVELLCNKDMFRKFLKENGFHTPGAVSFSRTNIQEDELDGLSWPLLVKPVDSSGSKGVSLVNSYHELAEKANYAMSFSRSGRIILEEYVEKGALQIAGDGLSINGDFVFACLADDHFDSSCDNPFVPVAATFPCTLPLDVQARVKEEVQRLIGLLRMKTCTYNLDIHYGSDGNIYLMEIAPRSGGNYIPQIIKYMTGVDMVEYAILGAMGEDLPIPVVDESEKYYAYYAIHSNVSGTLERLEFNPEPGSKIVESHLLVWPGDRVKKFVSSNATLGVLLLSFESNEQMHRMITNPSTWIDMVVV